MIVHFFDDNGNHCGEFTTATFREIKQHVDALIKQRTVRVEYRLKSHPFNWKISKRAGDLFLERLADSLGPPPTDNVHSETILKQQLSASPLSNEGCFMLRKVELDGKTGKYLSVSGRASIKNRESPNAACYATVAEALKDVDRPRILVCPDGSELRCDEDGLVPTKIEYPVEVRGKYKIFRRFWEHPKELRATDEWFLWRTQNWGFGNQNRRAGYGNGILSFATKDEAVSYAEGLAANRGCSIFVSTPSSEIHVKGSHFIYDAHWTDQLYTADPKDVDQHILEKLLSNPEYQRTLPENSRFRAKLQKQNAEYFLPSQETTRDTIVCLPGESNVRDLEQIKKKPGTASCPRSGFDSNLESVSKGCGQGHHKKMSTPTGVSPEKNCKTDSCPACGFRYKWDSVKKSCGHCHYGEAVTRKASPAKKVEKTNHCPSCGFGYKWDSVKKSCGHCHYVESRDKKTEPKNNVQQNKQSPSNDFKSWMRRKVIELFLQSRSKH